MSHTRCTHGKGSSQLMSIACKTLRARAHLPVGRKHLVETATSKQVYWKKNYKMGGLLVDTQHDGHLSYMYLMNGDLVLCRSGMFVRTNNYRHVNSHDLFGSVELYQCNNIATATATDRRQVHG